MPTQSEREIRITNTLGLHARAAASFVKTANQFQASILVSKGTVHVNGKSIMGILMLAAAIGTRIVIAAEGPDAEGAVDALCALVKDNFGEE